MRKKISSLLAIFLILSLLLPGYAIAIEPQDGLQSGIYTYSVSEEGNATITACDTNASGAVSIPSVLGGYPVTVIGQMAFEKCREITEIVVPESVKGIWYSAFRDTGISKITIPDNTISSIAAYLFYDCSQLSEIRIPEGVTEIYNNAFRNCLNLAEVQFPQTLEIIGERAFQDCWDLGNVALPEKVSKINARAFYNCETLKTVFIPDTVTSIGDYAFNGCGALKYVFYEGSEDEWKNISKGITNGKLDELVIFDYSVKKYTFEENGGSHVADIEDYGIIESPVTEKEGFEFDGWYDNAGCEGEKISFPYYAGETTLYANWIPKKTYKFNSNGGSPVRDIIAVSVVETPMSNKEGFRLVGWYDNPELLGDATVFPYDGDCTQFYAKWLQISGIEIGDYIQIGTYLGEPIIWRYVVDDENGKMLISDKQLTMKCFSGGSFEGEEPSYGSNNWETSDIRSWLNSTAPAGDVEWLDGTAPDSDTTFGGYNAYDDEPGFLSEDNFSKDELGLIKMSGYKNYTEGIAGRNMNEMGDYCGIEDVELDFSSVSFNIIEDRMFIPDLLQLKQIHENRAVLGDTYYYAYPTEAAMNQTDVLHDNYWDVWIRNPYSNFEEGMGDTSSPCVLYNVRGDSFFIGFRASAGSDMTGVRPAFYLNDDAEIMSGNGTEKQPYILSLNSAHTKTTVSDDGKTFTVTPVNIEEGKNVILALYDGEKLVDIQNGIYKGEAIPFVTSSTYTRAKVVVWDDLKNLQPVCGVENIK